MAGIDLPDIDLDGRVVIMTGADRGLGHAMSLGLAEKGARMVLASPAADGLRAVAAEIGDIAGPGRALVVETDITDLASCENCLKATREAFGGIEVLVNNARRLRRDPGIPEGANHQGIPEGANHQGIPEGANHQGIPEGANHQVFWQSDPEIYRQTVEVNVTGTFLMARTVARYFVEKDYGKIVNITTSIRNFYGERQSPYGVTKAAIDSSTYIWSEDLKGKGVTVNALLPGGACDTDPSRPAMPGRKLLPVDIMNPVLVWLCSTRSDGATGWRYNGSLWDSSADPDAAAAGCREAPSIRGVGT